MKVINKRNPRYSYNRFNIPYWDLHRRRYYPWIYPDYFYPIYPNMIDQQIADQSIINTGVMTDTNQSVVQTLFGKNLSTVPAPTTPIIPKTPT